MKACDLVGIAEEAAKEMGYDLWMRFLGHGLGLDIHERPDMGVEETKLAAGMVLAIEPRIAPNRKYIVGFEDMLLVTESGFESLTKYEKTFEIASKN
jgi:Xaa-Pro aminopeptidase